MCPPTYCFPAPAFSKLYCRDRPLFFICHPHGRFYFSVQCIQGMSHAWEQHLNLSRPWHILWQIVQYLRLVLKLFQIRNGLISLPLLTLILYRHKINVLPQSKYSNMQSGYLFRVSSFFNSDLFCILPVLKRYWKCNLRRGKKPADKTSECRIHHCADICQKHHPGK